jgi:hypothetical protein
MTTAIITGRPGPIRGMTCEAPSVTDKAATGPSGGCDAGLPGRRQRIDALPPHADPDQRRYRCQICNWVTRDVRTDGLHKLIEYP